MALCLPDAPRSRPHVRWSCSADRSPLGGEGDAPYLLESPSRTDRRGCGLTLVAVFGILWPGCCHCRWQHAPPETAGRSTETSLHGGRRGCGEPASSVRHAARPVAHGLAVAGPAGLLIGVIQHGPGAVQGAGHDMAVDPVGGVDAAVPKPA